MKNKVIIENGIPVEYTPEDRLDQLEEDVRKLKNSQRTAKWMETIFFPDLLSRYIGEPWQCCSCGKQRLYAIEKPGMEREHEGWGGFMKKVSVCSTCAKDFEEDS